MKYPKVILIFILLLLIGIMPVIAVNTYLGSSPQMSAVLSGVNEFTPGQDASINILIQNSGLNTIKFNTTGTIDRDDLPTTAKMVTVSLSSGNAPLVIKSDPQNIGDLKSQDKMSVTILAKITSDATMGEYTLPLTIRYTYLASSEQPASEILQSDYRQLNETFPITIRIKPQVKIEVLNVDSENLSVGSGGYLNITIKNTGYEDGKKATMKILRNGNSPIIPTDSSVFVGDFPRNGIISCRYKVAVSSEAEKQTYPVDVAVSYENRDGDVVTSAFDTIGIPVIGKAVFAVTSGTVRVIPGSGQVIDVEYQNTGDITAYNTQARLLAVDPFKSSDDTAYLGDLKPDEKATARYQLSVDGAANVNNYTLDTEVRYRDALDNSQVSDTFKVPVQVIPEPVSDSIIPVLEAILCIVLFCTVAGYYLLVMRKKK
jgi:hypothetical protein